MIELIIPIFIFSIWIAFSVIFIRRYKYYQTTETANKKSFWNNSYIFESIPPVFPTLGIFCTALGITIGIWDFNTTDIQGSIPQLLQGLRIAFFATMFGIIGLIVSQKYNAIIQKKIDDDPNKPSKQLDEISAIIELTAAVMDLKKDNHIQFERLIQSFAINLETKVSLKLSVIEKEVINLQRIEKENQKTTTEGLVQINTSSNNSRIELTDQLTKLNIEQKATTEGVNRLDKTSSDSKIGLIEQLTKLNNEQKATNEGINLVVKTSTDSKIELIEQLTKLREEQNVTSEKANRNTDEIIKAMSDNSKLTFKKFDEFSDLLSKNNTEAFVEVLKKTTEQFNEQMSELINRLVKENFTELNNSVQNLNDWQKENKEQVHKLTSQFQKTTEMFSITATTLKDVAENTKSLTDDDSKLIQIVQELERVMIDDGKFQEITDKLGLTIETLKNTTVDFHETTSKLNNWVKTEKNFKEAAQILILKLEEFRDFNGDVWANYRNEMQGAVSIIKQSSTSLNTDLENINSEFYERLNDTLTNLDQCIQRFVPTEYKL